MRFTKPAATAFTLLAVLPAGAIAATIVGGPENERLIGTRYADTIDGNRQRVAVGIDPFKIRRHQRRPLQRDAHAPDPSRQP